MASTGDYFSIAGDLLGGVTSLTSGNTAAKGYQASASGARANAGLAGEASAISILQKQREVNQVIGGAYADVGANGLALSGSALDVIKSSKSNAALDIALMRKQGQMNVNDWNSKAAAYDAQASAAKSSGGGGFLGGLLKAATTALAFI